jgi:hypothetical protein
MSDLAVMCVTGAGLTWVPSCLPTQSQEVSWCTGSSWGQQVRRTNPPPSCLADLQLHGNGSGEGREWRQGSRVRVGTIFQSQLFTQHGCCILPTECCHEEPSLLPLHMLLQATPSGRLSPPPWPTPSVCRCRR